MNPVRDYFSWVLEGNLVDMHEGCFLILSEDLHRKLNVRCRPFEFTRLNQILRDRFWVQ